MADYRRFGLYMVPQGALYAAGAGWLGWDSAAGRRVPQPQLPGLPLAAEQLSAIPRKYGLHGTLKPPFRLASGMTAGALAEATRAFCATQPPLDIPRMAVRRLGRFLAIVPEEPCAPLARLAADTVRVLDPFRADPCEAELARRRRNGLTARQDDMLRQWGYPYVLEEFRFHITLTGPLAPEVAAPTLDALTPYFAPHLGAPVPVHSLALMGEDAEGRFHLIQRYPLSG